MDGFSQALLELLNGDLDPTARDYLDRSRRASQRMHQLIDDLLKLSRLNRTEIQFTRVDLTGLAEQVAADLVTEYPSHQVEFRAAPGLVVEGDERLLRIVLENLLGNAWKFTGRTANPVIEFGFERHEGQRVFFVRDNGAGFDMTYAAKLFGAFQRLHSTQEFPGTGIGLATVQRIVHRHGGRVWAQGEVRKGATIYFTLRE
jgi:light-regulated signal transduction histidine kinase (bacteriophytochrome)